MVFQKEKSQQRLQSQLIVPRLVALFPSFGIYRWDKKAIFRNFARAPRSWLATYILIQLFSAADLKMWLATFEDAFLVASQPTS